MSYQQRATPRARAPRGFSRPRREKSKARVKKHQISQADLEEKRRLTLDEVVEQSLNSLGSLGGQVFALSPFHEHFDRWLMSLRIVMDDFKSSPMVTIDDPFKEEMEKVFSDIESALIIERRAEDSRVESLQGLYSRIQGPRRMLSKVEQDHISEMRNFNVLKEQAIRSLKEEIETLQKELSEARNARPGFLSGITNKVWSRREERLAVMLAASEKKLEETSSSLVANEENLRNKFEINKLEINLQVDQKQREIEGLEATSQVDGSEPIRRAACEELSNSIKALVARLRMAHIS